MTSFLPEGYTVPTTSNYFKFNDGANTFRVLASAIVGFEYWNNENKPVRLQERPTVLPTDIKPNMNGVKEVRPFWAFPVWNYQQKRVQILEITQKSIMKDIKNYVDNKKWGNPQGYDITITRAKVSGKTEYRTIAEPHSDVPVEASVAFQDMNINLNELFNGGDPFAQESAPNTDF